MDMEAMIARINELAKKKKDGIPLTPEEEAEKKELYKTYLGVIRGNLTAQLDNIEVIEEDPENPGTYRTVIEAKNFPSEPTGECPAKSADATETEK